MGRLRAVSHLRKRSKSLSRPKVESGITPRLPSGQQGGLLGFLQAPARAILRAEQSIGCGIVDDFHVQGVIFYRPFHLGGDVA